MNAYGIEDDEEIDAGVTNDSMEGGVPNVPRDPDRERDAKLKDYFERQNGLRQGNRQLALSSLMNQSANQIGTIGGKAASSAPLDQFNKQLMAENQGMMAEDRSDMDRQEKMKNFLLKQKMGNEKATADLEYRKGRDTKTDEYRTKMLEASQAKTAAAASKEKEPSESERKFGAFATRAQSANDAYENYVTQNPKAAQLGTKDYLVGKYGGEMGSGMMSDEAKMTKQLEKEFIGSVLRPETGAAASDDEWAMYGAKYFPRVNDTDEQLSRKSLIRKQDIDTMRTIAGKAAGPHSNQIAEKTKAPPGAGLSPEEKAELDQLENKFNPKPSPTIGAVGSQSGGLSPEEKAELDQLEKELGG